MLFVVLTYAKIQIWKQFTTYLARSVYKPGCAYLCKDTNLKAIHNKNMGLPLDDDWLYETFKVHNFQQEMAAKLFDGKRLRSFDEWTKGTMGIASHQVGSWLETEYNTAVIRAHQAADWQEFACNKDILPNLRWMPTTSPEPDDKHKHYWMSRLTLPVDDPFWNEHYPGDRWNCKCSLEATDDPVHRPADIPEDKPQRGLDTNAGKTGEMFSQSHPYFPKDCAHCFAKRAVNGIATNSATAPSRPWLAVAVQEASASAFSRLRSFFNASKKKDCYNCPFIDGCMSKEGKKARKQIEPETFSEVKGTDGLVRISSKHGDSEKAENIKVATYLAKKYKQRIDLIANPEGTTSPDSYNHTRGVYQEYKVNASKFPTEGSIDNLLHKANKQAYHVVLVVESGISNVHLANAIQNRLQRESNKIKEVIVVKDGKDATYDLRQILQKGFKIEPADFK